MTDFTSERRLCDDDGRVSQANVPGDEFLTYLGQHNRLAALTGHPPVYEPFDCTGSAHLAGEHIRCTSPAHTDEAPPTWKRQVYELSPLELASVLNLTGELVSVVQDPITGYVTIVTAGEDCDSHLVGSYIDPKRLRLCATYEGDVVVSESREWK